MKENSNKHKGYIITDMELGDSLDNIIFMYEEPFLELKNENKMEANEGTDLNP